MNKSGIMSLLGLVTLSTLKSTGSFSASKRKEIRIESVDQLRDLVKDPKVLEETTKLSMGHLGLSVVPKEVLLFKNLESIYLEDNNISEFPIELFTLSDLKFILLSRNKISRLPSFIPERIESLDLSFNNIRTISSAETASLGSKMYSLNLSGHYDLADITLSELTLAAKAGLKRGIARTTASKRGLLSETWRPRVPAKIDYDSNTIVVSEGGTELERFLVDSFILKRKHGYPGFSPGTEIVIPSLSDYPNINTIEIDLSNDVGFHHIPDNVTLNFSSLPYCPKVTNVDIYGIQNLNVDSTSSFPNLRKLKIKYSDFVNFSIDMRNFQSLTDLTLSEIGSRIEERTVIRFSSPFPNTMNWLTLSGKEMFGITYFELPKDLGGDFHLIVGRNIRFSVTMDHIIRWKQSDLDEATFSKIASNAEDISPISSLRRF